MKKSDLDKLIEQVLAEKETLAKYAFPPSQGQQKPAVSTIKSKIGKDLNIPKSVSKQKGFLDDIAAIDKVDPKLKLDFPEELEFDLLDSGVAAATAKRYGRFSKTSGTRRRQNLIRANILFNNYNKTKVKKYLDRFYDVFDENATYDEDERKWRLGLFTNYYYFFRNLAGLGDEAAKFAKKMSDKFAILAKPTKTPRGASADAKTTSITDPTFATQAAASGKMLETQFIMFKQFFKGASMGDPKTLLTQRIKKLTEFSKEVAEAKDVNEALTADETKENITGFLNKTMVLDYFSTFAKDIDSGAGAYIFEAFCAYMAGGQVGGKDPGASGGMGETDFFFADGSKGSAKYLKQGTKVTQSFANFILGQNVTYIFASKRGEENAPASDADEVLYIDMYIFDVEKTSDQLKSGRAQFKVDGQPKELEMSKTKVVFPTPSEPVGTLALVTTSGENIQKNLTAAAAKVDVMVERATKAFIATMDELKKAKESVQNYSNTGDMNPHGKKATDSLNKAGSQFKKVMLAMQNKPEEEATEEPEQPQQREEPQPAQPPPRANESKLPIDSLIETIVKQKLLK